MFDEKVLTQIGEAMVLGSTMPAAYLGAEAEQRYGDEHDNHYRIVFTDLHLGGYYAFNASHNFAMQEVTPTSDAVPVIPTSVTTTKYVEVVEFA